MLKYMMNQPNYYSKYLKYKKKYLDLKKLKGGDDDEEVKGPTPSEIMLNQNANVELYIKGFENDFENTDKKKYCEIINSENDVEYKLIIKFNNKDISFAPQELFQKYKKNNENYSISFGELYKNNESDIKKYCDLYNDENQPEVIEEGGVVTSLDSKNTNQDIQESIKKENEVNEVTNIFAR